MTATKQKPNVNFQTVRHSLKETIAVKKKLLASIRAENEINYLATDAVAIDLLEIHIDEFQQLLDSVEICCDQIDQVLNMTDRPVWPWTL